MKKYLIIACIVVIISCTKESNPYLITKTNVGMLTDSTQVKDLALVFHNDSIAKFNRTDEFIGNINDIDVYDTEGKLLLVLTPAVLADSTSTIKMVRVEDARYETSKGISTISTFKELNDNYKINKVLNTISNVILTVDELNAYFTIDKSELPSNMRTNIDMKIDLVQIPDGAKIKNFTLHWY